MKDRFKVVPSVFIAVLDDDKILLQLRQNTGYFDDYYDLPSGHVEENEPILTAAAREVQEETNINTKESDLRLFHICQSMHTPERPYLYHFLKTEKWSGHPAVGDTEKIKTVGFYRLDELPPNTTPHVLVALNDLVSKSVGFSYLS